MEESRALASLQRSLTDGLASEGLPVDRRKFSPHITLGREVVSGAVPWPLEPFGEMVDRLELMKSERSGGKLVYSAIYIKSALNEPIDKQ